MDSLNDPNVAASSFKRAGRAPLEPQDPQQVGRYRLVARLGAGGMGRVYLARSPAGRTVALKVIRSEFAEDPEFRRRFRREVDAMRAVGGKYTAAVVDADPEGRLPWLATEYVAGPTLAKVVQQFGPLPERTLRVLAAGLADALTAIHVRGLIHRDLKPSNVMLTLSGPKVIDFGIARAIAGSDLTASGIMIGTPAFMSPEQAADRPIGAASDLYSLGSVLVFAATGEGPHGNASNGAVTLYKVIYEDADVDRVPSSVRRLVSVLLSKEPDSRPPADAVSRALAPDGVAALYGERWLPPELADELTRHSANALTVDLEVPWRLLGFRAAGPSEPPESGARSDREPRASVDPRSSNHPDTSSTERQDPRLERAVGRNTGTIPLRAVGAAEAETPEPKAGPAPDTSTPPDRAQPPALPAPARRAFLAAGSALLAGVFWWNFRGVFEGTGSGDASQSPPLPGAAQGPVTTGTPSVPGSDVTAPSQDFGGQAPHPQWAVSSSDYVDMLLLAPAGQQIAVVGSSVQGLSTESGKPVWKDSFDPTSAVSDGSTVYVGNNEIFSLRSYDIATGTETDTGSPKPNGVLVAVTNGVVCFEKPPEFGGGLYAFQRDSIAAIWVVNEITGTVFATSTGLLLNLAGAMMIAIGGEDGVQKWARMTGVDPSVETIHAADTERCYCSASVGRTLYTFALSTGKPGWSAVLPGPPSTILGVAVAPDGLVYAARTLNDQSGTCQVVALLASTGAAQWVYTSPVPLSAASPVLVGTKLMLLASGADGSSVVALDVATQRTAWVYKSPAESTGPSRSATTSSSTNGPVSRRGLRAAGTLGILWCNGTITALPA